MQFITNKINSNLYLDAERYDLMSLRAHKGRLMGIIDIIAHINEWCKKSYEKIHQEYTFFNECNLKTKLKRILIIPLTITSFVFFRGILHITIIVFNILGIAVPEIGRRARNVYRNLDYIREELRQWFEDTTDEVLKEAFQTFQFLPSEIDQEINQIPFSVMEQDIDQIRFYEADHKNNQNFLSLRPQKITQILASITLQKNNQTLPLITIEEINQKYRELARKFHPDKSQEEKEAFQKLQDAKRILLQPNSILTFLKKTILEYSNHLPLT